MRVPGLTDVVAAAGGSAHSLALLKDGTVRAWGTNKMGQLGDGTTDQSQTAAFAWLASQNAVGDRGGRRRVRGASGRRHGHDVGPATARTGGLGLNDDTPCPTPTLVPGATGLRAISIGGEHMVGLTRTGTVLSWGRRGSAKSDTPASQAAPIAGLTNVASVEAYTSRTFAVLAERHHHGRSARCRTGHASRVTKGVSTFPIPLVIKNLKNPM